MGRAFLQYNHTLLLLFGSIAVVADDSQLPQRLRQLDAARAAFARTPDRPSAYLLARALLSYGHVRPSTVSNAFYVEAAETYRRAAALGGAAPSDASLLVDEAAAWVQDGNGARAFAALADAEAALGCGVAEACAFPDATASRLWEARGDALDLQAGRDAAAAEAAYRTSLAAGARAPVLNKVCRLVSRERKRGGALGGDDAARRCVADIDAVVTAHSTSAYDGARLLYTAFALREGLGDHDGAFAALERANAIELRPEAERAALAASRDANLRVLKSIFATREGLAQLEAFSPRGRPERRPVFVVGLPRSGSTLVEAILGGHPRCHGLGEDSVYNPAMVAFRDGMAAATTGAELAALYESTADAVWRGMVAAAPPDKRERPGLVVVDKMLMNLRTLPFLHLLFPDARVVALARDAEDVVFSCFKAELTALALYNDLDDIVGELACDRDHLDHWRTVLPPGRVLELRYEDLVADFGNASARLLDFVGLPPVDGFDAADFHTRASQVQTCSKEQVNRPIYATAVGSAKPYAAHLAATNAKLAALAETRRRPAKKKKRKPAS